MGMYFNTAGTTEMNKKVNDAFASGSIDYWKKVGNRSLFGKIGEGGASLRYIAGQNGIYPGAGYNSSLGQKWFNWLDDLDSTTPIRNFFFKHLDSTLNCAELIFVPVPKAAMPITVTTSSLDNPDGTYSLTVTIYTPTAAVVRAAIKKTMKTRKKTKS